MNIKNKIKNRLMLPALFSLVTLTNAQTWSNLTELSLTNTAHAAQLDKTDENPVRGFIPGGYGHDNQFKYSVERRYLDFDLAYNTANNSLNVAAINNEIEKTTSQGAHVVLRVVCYYPGSNPFKWANAPKVTVNGTQYVDWNHATTMSTLKEFIRQFGAQYKNDERIVMVELGLYGNWGEWNVGPEEEMIVANRNVIVDAYQAAFDRGGPQNKFLGIRYVTALSSNHNGVDPVMNPKLMNMGIYDDSFSYQTIGNSLNYATNTHETWNTAQAMYNSKTTATYINAPRAGEPRPETVEGWKESGNSQYFGLFQKWPNHSKDTSYDFNGVNKVGKDEDFAKSVQAMRISWLGTHSLFMKTTSQTERDIAKKAVKLLGYQLVVSQTAVQRSGTSGATVGVKIKNNGVAPFYFNWNVEFKAVTSSGAEANLGFSKTGGTTWNLKEVSAKEGSIVTERTFTGTLSGLPSSACHVIMRFKNPLEANSLLARPLRFLNLEQDTRKQGWVTLASLPDSGGSGGGGTPILANGNYTIQRETGGAFLTATSRLNPITFGTSSGLNTKWTIVNQPTLNHVAIISESNAKTMLEVDQNALATGSLVRLSGDSTVRQHSTWKVERIDLPGPDSYRFLPVLNAGFAMDAWDKSESEKVVHLWNSDANNTNQRFKVTPTN